MRGPAGGKAFSWRVNGAFDTGWNCVPLPPLGLSRGGNSIRITAVNAGLKDRKFLPLVVR